LSNENPLLNPESTIDSAKTNPSESLIVTCTADKFELPLTRRCVRSVIVATLFCAWMLQLGTAVVNAMPTDESAVTAEGTRLKEPMVRMNFP